MLNCDAIETRVARQIAAIEHSLTANASGSLCRIPGGGAVPPQVKYDEGRYVAARQARRLIRYCADNNTTDDIPAELRQLLTQWIDLCATAETRSPDWRAYACGGRDALQHLLTPLSQ